MATDSSRVSVTERVESIDALRGFDMFCILGGERLIIGLNRASEGAGFHGLATIADQMDHVQWAGFRFYDLIFPLFVFLMGVSTVYSLTKLIDRKGKSAAYGRVLRRFAILYLLGLFYHGGMSRDGGAGNVSDTWESCIASPSATYSEGCCLSTYAFAACWRRLFCYSVGYWAVMTFVPVPGGEAGNYAEGANLANYIDAKYLPGYKWDGDWDPEGILSSFPAIATGLLGIFAGMLLRRKGLTAMQRVGYLALAGVFCLAAGWAWGLQFPIIKKLWTSSFVLYAGGWSYLLLALFYLMIDVWKIGVWHRPFVWIGMNCITVYMASNLVGGFGRLVRRVLHKETVASMGVWGNLTVTLLGLLVAIFFCRWLYNRKIFLRV